LLRRTLAAWVKELCIVKKEEYAVSLREQQMLEEAIQFWHVWKRLRKAAAWKAATADSHYHSRLIKGSLKQWIAFSSSSVHHHMAKAVADKTYE
jgi:hypothetical protein